VGGIPSGGLEGPPVDHVFFEWVTVNDGGFNALRTEQVLREMGEGVYGDIDVFFAGFGSTLNLVAVQTLQRCVENTDREFILFVPT